MDILSVFRVALRALARNKLRTVLTMLGITIGIGAVICAVAIGEGGSQEVEQQLLNLGDNLVWVEAGGRNVNGVRTGSHGTKSLKLSDAQAIAGIPFIKLVSPHVDDNVQLVYGNLNWYTRYRAVSPEYLTIRRWPLASGEALTQEDVATAADVCLLGQTVVERLFGGENPLGKTIRLKNLPFKVIGVLEPKGMSGTGWDQDDVILIPFTTAQHKVKGVDWLDDIMCSATSAETTLAAKEQITSLLRQRHRIRPGEPDDFNIRHPEDILQAREEASRTFTLMLASIASVSLLVGGIGIMNIMLVSVTERTREIGVRMAVGANERDIQLQFLTEAVVLSLLGGAAGVMTGILASLLFSNLLWAMPIHAWAIDVAVLFSVGVGIFFGYYPAQKAAALDPVEALRYE